MARVFSAPSFSLGLDFDLGDGEEDPIPNEISEPNSNPSSGEKKQEDDYEDEGFDNVDSVHSSPPVVQKFKRLRRGPRISPSPFTPVCPNSNSSTVTATTTGWVEDLPCLEDEIEDFSAQEDDDFHNIPPKAVASSKQTQSVCNSSKKSLHGSRILTTKSSGKLKRTCILPSSNTASLIDTEFNGNKVMFPKLTISPLRKIQFSDSDSDNTPTQERPESNRNDKKEDSSKKRTRHNDNDDRPPIQSRIPKSNILSSDKNINKSLWEDYFSKKNVNFATPALDNFCDEYYESADKSNIDQCKKGKTTMIDSNPHHPDYFTAGFDSHQNDGIVNDAEQQWDLPDPKPPCYQYFFHVDTRISKLVKARLLNFVPLCTQSPGASQPCKTESINYICQFGSKEASISAQRAAAKTPNTRSRKKKKNNVVANATDGQLDGSGNWTNPRSCMTNLRNIEGNMDCASNQSLGHWYTGQNGKKVYINKNGQELEGQIAYRHYRKETGVGFRKSKKKIATKNTKPRRQR